MTTMYQEREFPAPHVYPDNEAFWQAANAGTLLVKWCRACNAPHWYPRPICPHCGNSETEFRASQGNGSIYALTITRKAGPVAYALAYVTLEEGVTLLTNIVDCDFDALRIGDPVRVVFKAAAGGQMVPMFRPA
jgi:uncharacterized protein